MVCGMPSALHRLWEIAFNFVNDIWRTLILILPALKIRYTTVYLCWVEKEEKVQDNAVDTANNTVFISVVFNKDDWWNNI